ncbi:MULTISPECIES: cell division protein FtsQ/DivIB [Enterococcus]|uniref:cell division protein FtsQ/DivIB n=1 Tax=Enterococcus TaxID=1350 RepID=UPI0011064A44|nr:MULTISPECIES: cell division protein FtsQ/DivIB [Enterococcus]MDB1679262.1 cell division protein FtsQ/DivIB [Enterococcus durans]
MSKKKEPENLPNQSVDENNLTPWQKANRKYLAEHGKKEKEATKKTDNEVQPDEQEADAEPATEKDVPEHEHDAPSEDETEQIKAGGPYNGSFLNRLPNLKNQRNKVLYRRLALIITILGIPLIFLIYYVSPYSKLQAVTVSGNENVAAQTVITDTKLTMGTNIWKQYWHKADYINNLKEEQPRIENAQISFKTLNTFTLKVKEYKEIALVTKNGQYYPVMENGTVLSEKVANPTKNLPILDGFTNNEKIKSLTKEYNKLSAELQKAISEIKYTPSDTNKNLLRLNMNDGNQVIVNIQNLASQMKYYAQVAKDMDEKGVIDMEVGIFSYPYSESSAEAEQTSGTNSMETTTEQTNGSSASSEPSSEETVPSESEQTGNTSGDTSETNQNDDNSSSSSSISTEN